MKKVLLIPFLLIICVKVFSMSFTYEGIMYSVVSTEDKTVYVTRDNIPATYSGKVEIPEKVFYEGIEFTVIGISDYTFVDDSKLTEIILPKTITILGDQIFNNCQKLKSIIVSEDNPKYCDIDGVLFSKDKTQIIQYPNAKSSEYSLPTETKKVGENAFITCLSLKSLILNEGLEEIGTSAFYYDKALSELRIPSTVTTIGDGAFSKCKLTKLWACSSTPCNVSENTFPDEMYLTTVLYVPQGCVDVYKTYKGWKKFSKIEEFDVSGLYNVFDNSNQIEKVYTIKGTATEAANRGIYLIRMKNGNTKKVVVK